MAINKWMLRQQNFRSSRLRHSRPKQDNLTLSFTEDPHGSLKAILSHICQEGLSEANLLNYLTHLVKLTLHISGKFSDFGYSTYDILCCLQVSLTHESTQIRCGGLRCIRHILKVEEDIIHLNKLLIPYLITRSFDLALKNDVERIEAMKLMRKILIIAPLHFHISMARSLVSLANSGIEEKDRLLRICLATISELGVLNSNLFILSGGVSAVTRNLLECQTPKIAESLCGVLLLMLDKPSTRRHAAVDLSSVAAPFCDFHYKHGWKDKNRRDERELRLNCSRLALLTILRSWPGILHFCGPKHSSGLKAIIDVLYLNQLEVRKAVLDLLYELLGLPQPEWTDELSVALIAVDPCEPQASWRLNEGFVAAEGRCILPHLAKTTPSTTDMYLALLLYCFLENGLLKALVKVIATSDTFISVRATVLLGELLRLIQIYLPPECCNVSPSLPSLVEYATKNKPQVMSAVTALQHLHKLMKKRPATYSLHLDYILRSNSHKVSGSKQERTAKVKHGGIKSKLNQFVIKENEDLVKETGVLLSSDALTWNWGFIRILLSGENDTKLNLQDTSHKLFIKKLVEFFTPSKNKYSHMDLSPSKISIEYTMTGIELINFLIELDDQEYTTMVLDFFKDILNNIDAITAGRSVHDCLFSPQHMLNTQCQSYFLFIGRFLTKSVGTRLLNTIGVFDRLKHLATSTNQDCYAKLIISSLDYTVPSEARNLLEAVLTCKIENSKLYATQFLLVLLRAGIPQFSDWGIRLLINQLKDSSRSIQNATLSILQEACELPECLESIINLKPDLEKLGEKGMLLFFRFLSSSNGFAKFNQSDGVIVEIKKWDEVWAGRYVKLVEDDISEALTLHQKEEEIGFEKKTSSLRPQCRNDFFLPTHLYGQLNQHEEGFRLLQKHGSLDIMLQRINEGLSTTNSMDVSDSEILNLKTALWTLGHLGGSRIGCELLISHGIIGAIVRLAQESLVYSIRATAYYSLGLIATTSLGADEMLKQGWICTRHNRHDYWPIINDESERKLYDMYLYNSTETLSFEAPFFTEAKISDSQSSLGDDIDIDTFFYSALDNCPKRSTLPINKNKQNIYHKRSFSESKTFDVINGLEDAFDDRNKLSMVGPQNDRRRNNSVAESTTSDVSFMNSWIDRKDGMWAASPTVGSVPNSTSLGFLQFPSRRRHRSSNCERLSFSSGIDSNLSSSSLSECIAEDTVQNFSPDGDDKSHVQLRRQQSLRLFDDWSSMENRFVSVFKVQKFTFFVNSTYVDRIYMGICLPQILVNLIPVIVHFPIDLSEVQPCSSLETNNFTVNRYSRHNVDLCLYCSRIEEVTKYFGEDESSKMDILKNIERLSNPIYAKTVKHLILQRKQRDNNNFKDICVYSEVCKLMSENTYKLTLRRLLHELFLSVDFKPMYNFVNNLISSKETEQANSSQNNVTTMKVNISNNVCKEPDKSLSESSSCSSNQKSIKTLDSLNLTYKENKFPIRKDK